MSRIRIVVIGDPHIEYPVADGWEDIIADIYPEHMAVG